MSAEIGRKLGYTKLFPSLKSFSLRFFRLKKRRFSLKKNQIPCNYPDVLFSEGVSISSVNLNKNQRLASGKVQ